MRLDFQRKEPRCRICRDESVPGSSYNDLLDWRGVPIILGGGKTHLVTYADILRELEPLNEGRDKKDRISYDSMGPRQEALRPAGKAAYLGRRPES